MENTLLNLIPSSYIPEVHLSQYDVGRELTFKLMDGNTEYSVPSGATVTVKATKPSGLGFVVSGTFSDNIVTIVNTETMTNESGRFSAELSISSGATLLGTSNFIFNIERSPHPEGTTDGDAETLIPELTLLVNEIRESNAKVESMTASASPLPSGSDPTAEYDAENNNLAFGIPVSEVTEEDLYKAFITKSASGSIASFSDGGDELPMKSLLVNIVPKQSGTGDASPSNVRAISGWDEVNVVRCGKNLVNSTISSQTINGITVAVNDGVVTLNGTASSLVALIVGTARLMEGKRYIISGMPSTSSSNKYFLNLAPSPSTGASDANYYIPTTITPISDLTETIRIYVRSGQTVNNLVFEPMIRLAEDTDKTYQPFSGYDTYPISLGQTVYGGTLDVVSGRLVIEDVKYVVDGSQPVSSSGTQPYGGIQAVVMPTPTKAYGNPYAYSDILCDRFKPYAGADEGLINGRTGNSNLYFNMPSAVTSATLARDWFRNNPTTVVYELATPTEIQLTPTEVNTLLGSNNIWSESGTVEVEYRADSTLAYEELANAIISLGGNI